MNRDIFGRPIRVEKQGKTYSVIKLTAEQVKTLAADGDALNLNAAHRVSDSTKFVLLQICDAVLTQQFRKQYGISYDRELAAANK